MAWYLDKVGELVGSVLERDEALVSAIPAFLPGRDLAHGHVLRSLSPRRPTGSSVGTLVEQQVIPADLPFAGRMVLAVTNRRMLVFERRRWRMLPGRLLGSIPNAALGNVEGSYRPTGGLAELELTIILGDGTAIGLRVPKVSSTTAKPSSAGRRSSSAGRDPRRIAVPRCWFAGRIRRCRCVRSARTSRAGRMPTARPSASATSTSPRTRRGVARSIARGSSPDWPTSPGSTER